MITSKQFDSIFHIEIDRPDRKNALVESMYVALMEKLVKADNNAETNVILLTAKGDIFCAGHDLDYFLNDPPKTPDAPPFAFLKTIAGVKKPIIAAVNGLAMGIGATLLFHCDLVYASQNASFLFPFVSLGLSPEGGSSYFLPKLLGHQRASEILLLNEKLTSTEAEAIGLVTKVVPSDSLLDTAINSATKLTRQPLRSVIETKALLKAADFKSVEMQMKKESEVFCHRVASPSAKEAFASFIEKRTPNFKGLQ